MQLRTYQQDCIQALVSDYKAGVRQLMAVLPTGAGKTIIFAQLPSAFKGIVPDGRTLVIAHTQELIDQAIDKLRRWNPTLKVGKEMAEHRADSDCDIVVACVASVGRQGTKRLGELWDDFSIVIVDECAHAIASTYLNVFESTGVLQPNTDKLVVGFTATPKRRDLKRTQKQQGITTLDDQDLLSLKSVFKKISYKYTIRQAVKDGWLCPPKGFRLKTDVSLDGIKTVAGDYAQDQLSEAVNIGARNLEIVKMWKENGQDRQTLVFAVDIAHAQALAQTFQAYGVRAEAIWGSDPDRAKKLEDHRQKRITVLTNCQVLTEGYDDWRIGCVVLARPTKSGSLFTQMLGRGLRLQDGTGNLHEAMKQGLSLEKVDCHVLDVVDVSQKCSLVTFPSLVGLNPAFDLHGQCAITAVEKLEELQEKHVGIDFSNLTDLSRVKAYIESVDLLSDPLAPEVKELTTLAWQSSQDGSYIINIPENQEIAQARQYYLFKHEKLIITQNQLEEYELSIASTQEERQLGIFNSLKEAFETADSVLRRCRPDRLKLMLRESPWHSYPASDASKKYLKRLLGKRPFAYCTCQVSPSTSGKAGEVCGACKKSQLTAGQASIAITRMKAKVT